MTNWDESQHARDQVGKFAEHVGSAPETTLTEPGSAEPVTVDRAEVARALNAAIAARRTLELASAKLIAAEVRKAHPNADRLEVIPNRGALSPGSILDASGAHIGVIDEDLWAETSVAWAGMTDTHRPWFDRTGHLAALQLDQVLRAPTVEGEADRTVRTARETAQKALASLHAAAARFNEKTDGGEVEVRSEFERYEDARLQFADYAETILTGLLKR